MSLKRALPVLLLVIYLAQCAWFIRTQSLTMDEPSHIAAGIDAWRHSSFSLLNDHPPLARMWFTLPLRDERWQVDIATVLSGGRASYVTPDPMSLATRARTMNVILGLTLAGVLWWTARRIFSEGGANLALALFVCFPATIAHFSVATTDGAATLFIFAAASCLFFWTQDPSWIRTAGLGVVLGLLLLAKFSTPPLFLLAVVWMLATKKWAKTLAAMFLAALVVWAGYRFHVSRASLDNGVFTAKIPNKPPIVSTHVPKQLAGLQLALLIPAGEYIDGLRAQVKRDLRGRSAFLMGETYNSGFWLYFPAAILLKWPTTLLVLSLCGLVLVIRRLVKVPSGFWMLASFPLVYLAFALLAKVNIGDRHVLPIAPFLLLFAAAVWQFVRSRRVLLVLVILVTALQAVDSLRYAPDYLSYFNFLVDPNQSHKLLVDSNLDWGQGLIAVRRYELDHPDETIQLSYFGSVSPLLYGIRARELDLKEEPSGTIIVSASFLSLAPERYPWLVQHPAKTLLNHSLHVFRFP